MKRISFSAISAALCLSAFATSIAFAQNSLTSFFDNESYYGPDCDETNYSGAYYTGDYTSAFKTYLGKTDEEIQEKLDQLWNHYFKGDNNSKVFFDQGDEAYIFDMGNNDVRSEGMSFGMMIAVQTNHKKEFDKLWNWTKNHMWHKGGSWDGYFAWRRGTSGTGGDDYSAPDGEMYFMMSLLFAANRWHDDQYMADAQYILKMMWDNSQHSLFSPQHYVITFQPHGEGNNYTDPAYDLPAFVDLFSRWSETNNDKWTKAAKATRNHLYKASNTTSGLFSDYSNYDGTPHSSEYYVDAEHYMRDAIRCAMNFGMDFYLFGADSARQVEMAKRIIDFFEGQDYQYAHYKWNGDRLSEDSAPYTLGETGANAVAALALKDMEGYEDIIKKNLQMAWDAKLMTGQFRYYDGLVHYLAMLHLCGSFKIWKPAPEIKEKPIEGTEYNGQTFAKGDTIYVFESCQLYRTIFGSGTTGFTPMTPRTVEYKMLRDYDLKGCRVNGNKASRGAYYGKKVLAK